MTDPHDGSRTDERQPLALALKYDGTGAPRLVAKGRGAIAATIIAKAQENGIEIEKDPVLAEALASVELDTEIPIALYSAVAQVIGTILSARKRSG